MPHGALALFCQIIVMKRQIIMSRIHPDVLIPPNGPSAHRVVAYVLDIQRGGGRPQHKHDRAQLLAVTSGSIAVVAALSK